MWKQMRCYIHKKIKSWIIKRVTKMIAQFVLFSRPETTFYPILVLGIAVLNLVQARSLPLNVNKRTMPHKCLQCVYHITTLF